MISPIPKMAWATAKLNPDFFCVETCSGYRMTITDPRGKQHLLPVGASDRELGSALLDALAHSRFVPPLEQPEEDLELFDFDLAEKAYADWVEKLMRTYGYKTRRALFKDMANCNIERCQGMITIHPTNHEKLEGWSGDGISKES